MNCSVKRQSLLGLSVMTNFVLQFYENIILPYTRLAFYTELFCKKLLARILHNKNIRI
jgi:hypothetical protein